MKRKLQLLLVVAFAWAGVALGQTNDNPPEIARPPKVQPGVKLSSTNSPSAKDNSDQISIDPDFSVIEAVQFLAGELGIKFKIAPELNQNGRPAPELQQTVGNNDFKGLSAAQVLDKILSKNNLMLGKDPVAGDIVLSTTKADLVKVTEKLGESDGGDDLDVYSDPNKEWSLETAILILGKLSKLNILIDPRIKTGGKRFIGTNEIDLPNITTNKVRIPSYAGVGADQTLAAILDVYELTKMTDPKTKITKITFKDAAAKDPVNRYVVKLNYSSPTNMVTLLSKSFDKALFMPENRTGQLLMLATQKEFEEVTNLLVQLDAPTKQVLIEARFLETSKNPKSLRGIDWTDTLQQQKFTFGNGTLSGGGTTTVSDSPSTGTLPSGRPVGGNTTTSSSSATASQVFGSQNVALNTASGFAPTVGFLNAQGVNAVLSFLNTEAETKLLSTPRAVTLDNQETRLEVTRSIPIFDSVDALGSGGSTISSTKPTYTNIGTILLVTPHITGTNVAMKVKPEISRVEAQLARKVVAGRVNEAEIFATSRIETQVIIPSGNTLVMGGLMSDTVNNNFSKVPILGDIPLLGYAFRRESRDHNKANLIIFVTPTIISDLDFQPYKTEYLKSKMPEHDDAETGPLNSGKAANPGRYFIYPHTSEHKVIQD